MNKTQAIVFFSIVVVGLGVSIVTLNKFGKQVEVVEKGEGKTPSTEDPSNPETPTTPDTPKTPNETGVGEPNEKSPVAAPKVDDFASADALMSAMADSVKNRDAETFLKIAGPEAATPLVQAQVKQLIESLEFELDVENPSAQVAKVAGSFSRWAIRLKQTDGGKLPESAPEIAEIYTDVVRNENEEWDIAKIAIPLEVAGFLSEMSGAVAQNPSNPKIPDPIGVDAPDALTVAHAFSKAIVDHNFKLAREMTDKEAISDERVAALMIAVEEGKFDLRKQEPLVVTLNREAMVWVLTRIEGEGSNSEFGLEMAKAGDDWKINGLAFNKLLTALADKAGAGSTAYAPIVENPQGGESLVIYFDFDDAGVTSRANRQLEIVADILKNDPERKIRINGHADALGTDQYNEALSNTRSASIRKALLAAGVAAKQIVTESFGESRPLRPNFKNDGTDDPSGRSQNRRAEVYLDF